MFYPSSVLVSRTPGIATIWLMATLGARQNSKKVSKQAILQIDIPEACQAVQYPDTPMALRLQSNLLYGISRIYSQKCLFVLAEAEATQNTLRNLSRLVRMSEIDPRAGKIKPELLVVPDDISFVLDINFPMIDFDASISFDSSGASLLASSFENLSHASSQTNKSLFNFDIPQLDIPSSGSFAGDPGLPLDLGQSSVDNRLSADLDGADFLYDADFEFDAAGNIVDHAMPEAVPPRSSQTEQNMDLEQDTTRPMAGTLPVDTVQPTNQIEDEFPSFLDDTSSFQDNGGQRMSDESFHPIEASEHFDMPQARRKRIATKLLPMDIPTVLPASQIRQDEQDYVSYMSEIRRAKKKKSRACYKENAALVLDNIGWIGGATGGRMIANPLRKLAIDVLEQLTGISSGKNVPKKNLKRRISSADFSSPASESPRSRVRVHDEREEFRGNLIDNEEGYTGVFDETVASIELAREAMTMIEDQSTQLPLPWSGSRTGSVRSGRLSRQASVLSGRIAGNTSVTHTGSLRLFDRRASRLPTTSPLVGTAGAHNTPGSLPRGLHLDSQNDDFMFDVGGDMDSSPQGPGLDIQGFDLLSPLAAEHSSGMVRENADFLAWIQDAIATKVQQVEEDNESSPKITFDELLPTQEHSRAVAAQGFLQLLALANSGTITVSQQNKNENSGDDLWWGPLDISLVK